MGNGNQGEPVVITCQPLTGLAFLWSTNITISNLSLVGCGILLEKCTRYQAAIWFTGCVSVNLCNLHVKQSNGTGAIVYNARGKVNIESCHFSYNGLSNESGGGGLVIEASEATSQSFCTITNSTFTHNTASSAAGQWINPCGSTTRGGGISVVLRGEATNNTVQLINSVRLNNNIAQFGGGLYLAFCDNTSGNTVTVDNAEVTENEASTERAYYASGGGIFVGFNSNRLFGKNTVAINSSRIISNKADIGGGISVYLMHKAHKCLTETDDNKLVIKNCVFDNNTAFQGSSAYLSQSFKCSQHLLYITVGNSSFTNGHCHSVSNNWNILPCDGNFLVESLSQVVFQGAILFTGDQQLSALSLHSSSVELSSSAQLQFINNSAYNGAGIHLVGSSSIILNTGSTLLFKDNIASGQGGAIYADTCTLGQTGLEDCVFKHSNPSLHPDDWGVDVTFSNNRLTSGQASAISVELIQSYNILPNSFSSTFCWTGWSYDTYWCTSQLRSSAVYLNYTGSLNYTIYSGKILQEIVQFKVRDIWGNDVTDPAEILVEVVSGLAHIDPPGTLSSSIRVDCFSDYNITPSLLYIHPLQFPIVPVTVYFDQCESQRHIDCNNCQSQKMFGACPASYRDKFNPYCIKSRTGILCGKCKNGYAVAINDPDLSCIKCDSPYYGVAIFLFLQLIPTLFLLTLLAVLHINITDGGLSGFVLFSQMTTLQFPGLGYTSWSPTSTATNYCFSDTYFYYYYLSIPLTVYSIWNLNFLNLDPVPFCIPLIDTAAETLLLQYITAACPLVFIAVTYTWIKWYNNGYRLVVYATRPVHQLLARFWQKFKINPSLIDTYAGLMILSYMRFLATSAKLLKFTFVVKGNIDDHYSEDRNYTVAFYYDANLRYFGWPHAVYGVLAILCLLVFVVTPTIVLLFYHLKSFQQCLTRCRLGRPGLHALVDAYQGCFKNSATDGSERRYFAGIYLLFRLCHVAFIVTPTPVPYFVIEELCSSFIMTAMMFLFRPYKKVVHNFTNIIFVFFLLLLSITALITAFVRNDFIIPIIMPIISLCLMYVPFLSLCLYLTYRLLKFCCVQTFRKIKTKKIAVDEEPEPDQEQAPLIVPVSTVSINDFVADSMYADRILNPSEYK